MPASVFPQPLPLDSERLEALETLVSRLGFRVLWLEAQHSLHTASIADLAIAETIHREERRGDLAVVRRDDGS